MLRVGTSDHQQHQRVGLMLGADTNQADVATLSCRMNVWTTNTISTVSTNATTDQPLGSHAAGELMA